MRCTLSRSGLKIAFERVKAGLPPLHKKLADTYYTVLIEANERGVFFTTTDGTISMTTRVAEAMAVSASALYEGA